MPKKQKTMYAILGLLSWKPMSGYDIKKLVEEGLSHFWNESYGQLFPTLKRLVAEGLATRDAAPTSGKRARYVYTITPEGRREFFDWLREPSDSPRMRNELQLKFFLSSRSDVEESIRLLEEYREQQRERYVDYKDSERILARALREKEVPAELLELKSVLGWESPGEDESRRNELLIFYLTLRHGILAVEARLAWIEESLAALRRAQQGKLEVLDVQDDG